MGSGGTARDYGHEQLCNSCRKPIVDHPNREQLCSLLRDAEEAARTMYKLPMLINHADEMLARWPWLEEKTS